MSKEDGKNPGESPEDPKDVRPGDLPEAGKKESPSVLNSFVSDEWFTDREDTLTDEEKTIGVAYDGESLVFDTETLDQAELGKINSFLQAFERYSFAGTQFEYYFAEDSWDHIEQIASALKTRRDILNGKLPKDTLKNLNLSDEIERAANFMRDIAKREKIRTGIEEQAKYLPFDEVILKDKTTGKETIYKFKPEDMFTHGGPLDFIFVNDTNGVPTLTISTKDKTKEVAGFQFSSDEVAKGKFEPSDWDKKDGEYYSVSVSKGDAPVRPMFSQIRFIIPPVDMDSELDKYYDEFNERQAAKQRPTPSQYAPTPPSAPSLQPSSSRIQSSPSVVRSG